MLSQGRRCIRKDSGAGHGRGSHRDRVASREVRDEHKCGRTGSWRRGRRRKNAGAEGSDETAAAAEKTSFDLKLVGFDAKAKIKVIKEVRTMASLGLKGGQGSCRGSAQDSDDGN